MDAVAIVLGAGQGERLRAGGPKGLVEIAGRTLVEWSARALATARGVDGVLCVVPRGAESQVRTALAKGWPGPGRLEFPIAGGATRQASLAAALRVLGGSAYRFALVHDAARCCVLASDAEAVLAAARETGAAIPVVPVAETVKRVRDGVIVETVPREALALAQTPQAFRLALLGEALEKAERDGFTGTDCASLVERLGATVRACPGRVENLKVTHPADLERAQAWLVAREPRA